MSSVMHVAKHYAWKLLQEAIIASNVVPAERKQPHVYYGGARSGYAGGPQVKVGLLQSAFPCVRAGFNLVYLLSGALYLSPRAISRLKTRSIPIVLNQNGVYFPAWYPKGWERKNEELAEVLAAADHVFYQSSFCQRAADRFLHVKAKSSEVLHNCVDTTVFTPQKEKRLLSAAPVRLLLTGKIGSSVESRLFSTIEGMAAARRSGANVVLDVRGVIEDAVMAKVPGVISACNAEGSVFFHGPYNRADAPEIYRKADIYVMNNHNDCCPNAVLEALSCGLPVLYSISGGVPELVGEKAGYGMEVEERFDVKVMPTSEQFVQGLEIIVRNHEEMCCQARDRACSMFDLRHWYHRHEEVFLSLLR